MLLLHVRIADITSLDRYLINKYSVELDFYLSL